MKEEMRNFFRSKPAEVRELSSKRRERKLAFVRLARMLGGELTSIVRMSVSKRSRGVLRFVPGVLGRQDMLSQGLPGALHSFPTRGRDRFPRDDLEKSRFRE